MADQQRWLEESGLRLYLAAHTQTQITNSKARQLYEYNLDRDSMRKKLNPQPPDSGFLLPYITWPLLLASPLSDLIGLHSQP